MFPAGCVGTQILIEIISYVVVRPVVGLLAINQLIACDLKRLGGHEAGCGERRDWFFLFLVVG
ncbi:MAG: hypothetical protein FD177_1522 [Desulfovibrionaceae bacterium]|nr:MAG: hypothetical protein FD177_1522 [Desulfovibrionaceae bacterium]